jgi:hypothetical protein
VYSSLMVNLNAPVVIVVALLVKEILPFVMGRA